MSARRRLVWLIPKIIPLKPTTSSAAARIGTTPVGANDARGMSNSPIAITSSAPVMARPTPKRRLAHPAAAAPRMPPTPPTAKISPRAAGATSRWSTT
jgi:hypothetical protein